MNSDARIGKWQQLDKTTDGADGTTAKQFSTTTLFAQVAMVFNKSDQPITIGPTGTPNLWTVLSGECFVIPMLQRTWFNLADWYFKAENSAHINKAVKILYI